MVRGKSIVLFFLGGLFVVTANFFVVTTEAETGDPLQGELKLTLDASVDPKDPIPTFPIDPNLMISVEIPEILAFAAVEDEHVVSVDHTIKNLSSLPVQVEVVDYTDVTPNTFAYFEELGLTTAGYAQGGDVELVRGGNGGSLGQLMKLSAGSNTPTSQTANDELQNNQGWTSVNAFQFDGVVESSAFASNKGAVAHEITLKFTALKWDGSGPWDGSEQVPVVP